MEKKEHLALLKIIKLKMFLILINNAIVKSALLNKIMSITHTGKKQPKERLITFIFCSFKCIKQKPKLIIKVRCLKNLSLSNLSAFWKSKKNS